VFKNLLIGVAIFGLGWGASFGAGAAWGRRSVAPPVQAQVLTPGQFAAGGTGQGGFGAQGGTGGAGAGGAQTQGRGATAGTVDHVDGQTLYLTEANGQQVRVNLTDQTQITKLDRGAAEDLTAGSRVAVVPQGQPGADGALTAASVNVLPEGAALPGQGQAAGGQQRQGGGQQRQGGQGGQQRQGG
jgi:hypothetical protein